MNGRRSEPGIAETRVSQPRYAAVCRTEERAGAPLDAGPSYRVWDIRQGTLDGWEEMAETRYLASIKSEHYSTIAHIHGIHLPPTWNEWYAEYSAVRTEHIERGEPVNDIDVEPAEFLRFCTGRFPQINDECLAKFAIEKGHGHRF